MPSLDDALNTPVSPSLPHTWTVGEALVFLAEAYEGATDERVAETIVLNLQAACIAAGADDGSRLYELGFLTPPSLTSTRDYD